MAFSVEMPELGESVTEGTVTTWLKQVGDTVAVDEPLLEVSTDKVDTEIPSPVAGVLTKIIADEDDTVEVGEVIAEIGEEGDDTSSDDSGASESSDSDAGDSDPEEKSSSEGEQSQKSSDSGSSGSTSGGATDVEMPELGESVTEGTITQWLKNVGDEVEVDEPLLEVSTDKVDTEIPSPVAGTLVEVLAEEDDTVDVGSVIARIGDANAASGSSDDKKAEETKPEEKSEPEPSKSEKAGKAEETKDTSNSATSSETASPKASSASAPDREEPATRPSTKVNNGGKLPYVTRWYESWRRSTALISPRLKAPESVDESASRTFLPPPRRRRLHRIRRRQAEVQTRSRRRTARVQRGPPSASIQRRQS